MSFQDNRLFDSTAQWGTRVSVLPAVFPKVAVRTGAQPRAPRFLVARDREFAGWRGSLRELCKPTRLHLYTAPVRLFRDTPAAKFRFTGRTILVSVLFHLAFILLLPYLPAPSFLKARPGEVVAAEPGRIYYHLTTMDLSQKLPRIAIVGPGGHPGSDLEARRLPDPSSAAAHPKITIVLKPPRRADSAKQTIYQSASAPDLRIAMDLKLPILIVGTVAVPRPQIHFNPNGSRPTQLHKSQIAEPAPTLTASANSSPIPLSPLTSAQPQLPLPPPSSAGIGQGAEVAALVDGELPSGGGGSVLVVTGSDPIQAGSVLALPAGNRWAELSLSPTGGAGSTGNGHAGTANSGSSAAGNGGDGSLGAGRGKSGGGGGSSDGGGALGIAGGSGESLNAVDPMLPANMIFAVPVSALPRKNALVVSAGPMGGGGLAIYGALRCGKIYTVFLQMPGKSWTLQFCQVKQQTAKAPASRSTVVKLEQGLLPPDAELRFDFRRLPLPPENRGKMIVLKGLIREDGAVDQVAVYRSLLPQMDEAARLAFSQWKFKPAMSEGRPVGVEVLVGIPSAAPMAARLTE